MMKPIGLVHSILLASIVATIVTLVQKTTVDYTISDPLGSLMTSQAILQHGTLKLDDYPDFLATNPARVWPKRGHQYYLFPIGTPLFSVPFVALANLAGYDMRTHESQTQLAIAAFVAAGIFVGMFLTARLFLSDSRAMVSAALFWAGTSFSSTAGTALWSHDFAALFAIIAIYFGVYAWVTQQRPRWWLISVALFSAYLCRPPLALLTPVVGAFIFTYRRREAMLTVASVLALLGLFVLFSLKEYGQMLPDYYLPQRLASDHIWVAIYGNLFSPARGLLVFSPFLFLMLEALPDRRELWSRFKPVAILGLFPVVHLWTISHFPHWWAGWSYGPRLMTDALPAIFVVFVVTLSRVNVRHWASIGLLVVLGGWAVYVNVWQGMFNRYTPLWDAEPNIDLYPRYLFDWRNPQFLHSPERQVARLAEFRTAQISEKRVRNDEWLDHRSDKLYFEHWHGPESTHRWSDGYRSSVLFMISPEGKFRGYLSMNIGIHGTQSLKIHLNGKLLLDRTFTEGEQDLRLEFAPGILSSIGANRLDFELPNALRASESDPRIVAVAFRRLRIE